MGSLDPSEGASHLHPGVLAWKVLFVTYLSQWINLTRNDLSINVRSKEGFNE
jgi:hypothetical protein